VEVSWLNLGCDSRKDLDDCLQILSQHWLFGTKNVQSLGGIKASARSSLVYKESLSRVSQRQNSMPAHFHKETWVVNVSIRSASRSQHCLVNPDKKSVL
jgi:hypothetical protein